MDDNEADVPTSTRVAPGRARSVESVVRSMVNDPFAYTKRAREIVERVNNELGGVPKEKGMAYWLLGIDTMKNLILETALLAMHTPVPKALIQEMHDIPVLLDPANGESLKLVVMIGKKEFE